jgi:acetyl-CoA acetyltransferase
MNDVVILGVGMTSCGKFDGRDLYDMTRISVTDALKDAGITKDQVQAAYCGNLMPPWDFKEESIINSAGIIGQALLRPLGIDAIPIHNTRNACATGGAAFQLAYMDVASGFHDCVLVTAAEKGYMKDRELYLRIMSPPLKPGETLLRHSAPVEQHSKRCRAFMQKYGLTKEQIAWVCSKNHINASLNPLAQYRKPYTVEEVLADKPVAEPFTRVMCAPNSDGGGAAILCSKKFARKYTTKPIYAATSVMLKGREVYDPDQPALDERCAREAEERAGVSPADIGVAELSDAVAWTEITAYWGAGFCKKEDTPAFIDSKATALNGKHPVNTSGGMMSRGEPFGATGMLQIAEIIWQMRGQCGERQVAGPPKVGLSQISGGWQDWNSEDASCATAIFKK